MSIIGMSLVGIVGGEGTARDSRRPLASSLCESEVGTENPFLIPLECDFLERTVGPNLIPVLSIVYLSNVLSSPFAACRVAPSSGLCVYCRILIVREGEVESVALILLSVASEGTNKADFCFTDIRPL